MSAIAEKPRSITVHGRRWFQRTYGNTYHSVSVSVDGEHLASSGMHYGYGDQYLQTARALLVEAGILPDNDRAPALRLELEDMGIKLDYSVADVSRQKDL